MLLGKKYTRIKRACNAATIKVSLTAQDGTTINLPRKLNMLAVLSVHGLVNKKAADREIDKFIKRKQ